MYYKFSCGISQFRCNQCDFLNSGKLIIHVYTGLMARSCCQSNGDTSSIYSLAPKRSGWNSKCVILENTLLINIISISFCLPGIPMGSIDDQWALVQLMAWCHQAKILYHSQWHHDEFQWLSWMKDLSYKIQQISQATDSFSRPPWVN